jgi:hypothetical protein
MGDEICLAVYDGGHTTLITRAENSRKLLIKK